MKTASKPFGREVLNRENNMRPSNTTTNNPVLKVIKDVKKARKVVDAGTRRDPGIKGGGKAVRKTGNMFKPSKPHADNLWGNPSGITPR